MNLTFCYILADWEVLAYDDKMLEDTLFTKDFKISNRKYFLADARYYNTDYLLYSYYGVCYHLKKQVAVRKKLVNKEKLFNLRHLSLYNMIERIFRVTKRYFQIFKSALKYYNVMKSCDQLRDRSNLIKTISYYNSSQD